MRRRDFRRMNRRHPKRGVSGEEDQQLYDERVRLVRPGRLIAGAVLILAGMIWLALDALFGVHGGPAAPTPFSRPGPPVPALATPQSFAGGSANAALVARQGTLGGQAAPGGMRYLVIAVQVINQGPSILHIAATDFRLLGVTGGADPGRVVAGHETLFTDRGIAGGRRVGADLYWLVPVKQTPLRLQFMPPVPGGRPLVWAVS